jgi:hypothetical protein
MKAFDMVLRYRNNFDRIHRLAIVLIRPPRGRPKKHLSWIESSDNGLS